MTTRTCTKPQKPAVFTLLDVIELYCRHAFNKSSRVRLRVSLFSPLVALKICSTPAVFVRKTSNATPPALTKASLRSRYPAKVKLRACERPQGSSDKIYTAWHAWENALRGGGVRK